MVVVSYNRAGAMQTPTRIEGIEAI